MSRSFRAALIGVVVALCAFEAESDRSTTTTWLVLAAAVVAVVVAAVWPAPRNDDSADVLASRFVDDVGLLSR